MLTNITKKNKAILHATQVFTTQVGPLFKKLRNKCIRSGGGGGDTHTHTHDDIFFVKPTEEEKEKHFHII